MSVAQIVLETAVDMLTKQHDPAGDTLLREFDDIVIAISIDSDLPTQQVQSQLIDHMVLAPLFRSGEYLMDTKVRKPACLYRSGSNQ